jgi:hypothetical protein
MVFSALKVGTAALRHCVSKLRRCLLAHEFYVTPSCDGVSSRCSVLIQMMCLR